MGTAVRSRVGVHHLTLQDLLAAFIRPDARLEQLIEAGDGPEPLRLGVLLRKL